MKTEMVAFPEAAMSPAEMAKVKVVTDTKVVARSAPFQRTTEPYTNPEPLTVRTKSGSPAITAEGVRAFAGRTG